ALATLPEGRTPTADDWTRLSRSWRPLLDARIAAIERLRDDLDSCIGCGCLSLERCVLQNPGDRAATLGPGARYLEGDSPSDAARAAGQDATCGVRVTPARAGSSRGYEHTHDTQHTPPPRPDRRRRVRRRHGSGRARGTLPRPGGRHRRQPAAD